MANVKDYKHPVLFYFLATFFPWIFWFIAAYLSHHESGHSDYALMYGIFGVIGLASPAVVAFAMMRLDPILRHDLFNRIFNFSMVKPFYIFMTCFLMLASILLAQAISLLFGYSINQFELSTTTSFGYSLFPAWFMLVLAPVLEELAWHSYGTDCLRARFNLFNTSMIFALFWVIWHFPLSFIKDYYHSNLVHSGVIFALNFAFSLFPFVILMNWLYYKSNRNILIAVIFHVTAGVFNELFHTDPHSKIIQTALLCILSIYLLYKDRNFFFNRNLSSIQ